MEVKKYYIIYYISYQKEMTYYSLNVCDLVKETVQRHGSFGEVDCFSTFPESETNKCVSTDLFFVFGEV